MLNLQLLLIDPENDFCSPQGSLCVKGADKDMERVASLITRLKGKLKDIHVSLDEHHKFSIFHPTFWKDKSGNHPGNFTLISYDDVVNGVWTPVKLSLRKYAETYTKSLRDNGRYVLCIWPEHCLIGSWGANIYEPVFNALNDWASQGAIIDFVSKGSNFLTEHYSIVKADVPDSNDPSTQLNRRLLDTLNQADFILLAGEASSHCVKNTIEDIVSEFNADEAFCKKVVLLEDCMSPVPGFENLHDELMQKAKDWKFTISTSDKFLV